MTSSFSVEAYNRLLMIIPAHVRLREQLTSASKTLKNFIEDPAVLNLFLTGDNAGDFGICIMHRHYELLDGERMVSSADPNNPHIYITKPVSTPGPYFADRWMLDGTEFEHAVYPNGGNPCPPPEAFFEEFRRICGRYNVNILGICTAQLDVTPGDGKVFLEEAFGNPEDRMQKTTLVNRDDIVDQNPQQSAWIPWIETLSDETSKFSTLKCVHTCTSHIVSTEPQGPTLDEPLEFKAALDLCQDVPFVARVRSTNHI